MYICIRVTVLLLKGFFNNDAIILFVILWMLEIHKNIDDGIKIDSWSHKNLPKNQIYWYRNYFFLNKLLL